MVLILVSFEDHKKTPTPLPFCHFCEDNMTSGFLNGLAPMVKSFTLKKSHESYWSHTVLVEWCSHSKPQVFEVT